MAGDHLLKESLESFLLAGTTTVSPHAKSRGVSQVRPAVQYLVSKGHNFGVRCIVSLGHPCVVGRGDELPVPRLEFRGAKAVLP
jgi:hypothetical protein